MARTKLTPVQTLNTVLTQTNAGTAGGTMNYINLGGIKMLWIAIPSLASGSTFSVSLPSSFFTNVQSITMGIIGSAGTTNGAYIVVGTPSSSAFSFYTGTNFQGLYFTIIGN